MRFGLLLLASCRADKLLDMVGDVATAAITKLLSSANTSYPVPLPEVARARIRAGTEAEAKYYLSYATLSYCNSSVIRAWKCKSCQEMGGGWQVQEVLQDPLLQTQAVVAVNHKRKEIGVAFRGSTGLNNQIQNSLFRMVALPRLGPEVQVHHGFKNIADGLQAKVLAAFRAAWDKRTRGYGVSISGHSMGGSVAVILSFELQREFDIPWERFSIYTYGQPRTGNLAFVNLYNALPLKVTRTVNENDVVPHLPPNQQGYFHTLTELYIQGAQARLCAAAYVEDDSCSRSRLNNLSRESHDQYWGRHLGEKNCLPALD